MPKHTRKQQDFKLTAEWATGPRTAAWDALWHRILTDVLKDSGETHSVSSEDDLPKGAGDG